MTSAGELGPFGIRVNAIAPGLIFTDTIRAELSPAVVEMVMARQAIPQEGAERDIVEAMLYLVSDRASFVTGETHPRQRRRVDARVTRVRVTCPECCRAPRPARRAASGSAPRSSPSPAR